MAFHAALGGRSLLSSPISSGGLDPPPLGRTTLYFPSVVEITMGIGLFALSALTLTVLHKIAVTVESA